MAIGTSNKVIIEIDPGMKQQLYAKLKAQGLTMKDWFVRQAEAELKKGT